MEKVDKLIKPLELGKDYLVPCFVKKTIIVDTFYNVGDMKIIYKLNGHMELVEVTLDDLEKEIIIVNPIINHIHSDRENGQNYKHYHGDYRFKSDDNKVIVKVIDRVDNPTESIEYIKLKCRSLFNVAITDPKFISKSKLKHNCIYKGKCPHRGYDLTNEASDSDGVITCPLHGLKFDFETKKLITKFAV